MGTLLMKEFPNKGPDFSTTLICSGGLGGLGSFEVDNLGTGEGCRLALGISSLAGP